jgi:hypothetical protein
METDGVVLEYDQNMTYDMKDMIHFLRANGYCGLIVIAYGSNVKQNADSTVKKLKQRNYYSDAAEADLHITLPLIAEQIVTIAQACEKRLFSHIISNR